MLCLVSQLKTLNQNADAFEYQDQVGGVLSMPLVERATLWLAQSMLEEQIFPFKQTNYPNDMQRFRKIFSVFSRWFYSSRRRVPIIVAIQFFDSIYDHLGSSFNNAALLLFFCQLSLRLK